MGDISEHFNREEFTCKCGCGFDTVDVELIAVLELVRAYFKNKQDNNHLIITSGCRCYQHNKDEKGSSRSRHVWGQAVDFYFKFTSAEEVAEYLEYTYIESFGIGSYHNRTHLDIRRRPARWKG